MNVSWTSQELTLHERVMYDELMYEWCIRIFKCLFVYILDLYINTCLIAFLICN